MDDIVSVTRQAAEEVARRARAADEARKATDAAARQTRQAAASQAAQLISQAKAIIDEFTSERITCISSVTDRVLEDLHGIDSRMGHAEMVSRELDEVLVMLGELASEIAREARDSIP